ncbi:hypothetical protein KY304_01735 [Candidatus Woesearchaeota archaeon]|nr:hypothetical protein [Candidatus Woesearchaeota archaeon]MBW2978810.1 hypothetical protein [Candidatus Woesearchaeota archaeon]
MNVEKLKKVNQLSKEFKKYGMAMEDAIKEAGSTVNEKEVKEFLDKSSEEMKSSKNPSSTEQYILMLERNNRKIMEEVKKVKEEVTKILKEFEEMKTKLSEQQKQQIEQPQKHKIKKEKQSQLKKEQPTKKTTRKKSNPRQGEYNPEDVSIEKMFYFGKK